MKIPEGWRVWTSHTGSHFTGLVGKAHLVAPGEGRTLCNRPRGRMISRWQMFNPAEDCKRCAERFQEREGQQ